MIRTSFTVGKKEWEFLNQLIEMIGLRRDSYLGKRLAQEIETLKSLEKNSPDDVNLLKRKFEWAMAEKVKVSIVLPSSLVKEMNKCCADRRIPRGMFFHRFIQYVNLSTWKHLLGVANPRRLAFRTDMEWLDSLGRLSPILYELRERIRGRDNVDNEDSGAWESTIREWNSSFYGEFLNVKNDERKHLREGLEESEIARIFESL